VRINKNISTTLQLVNGTLGTVYGIICRPGKLGADGALPTRADSLGPQYQLPVVLLQIPNRDARFESFLRDVPNIVPVLAKEEPFRFNGRTGLAPSCLCRWRSA